MHAHIYASRWYSWGEGYPIPALPLTAHVLRALTHVHLGLLS
jgi:hypothetical protein